MVLNKEKAALLLDKLADYCEDHHIDLLPNKSLRYLELADMVIHRYGTVVLVEDNGDKYLCNNARYFKKWALKESMGKTGSPLKLSNCGKITKTFKKQQYG